MSEPTDTDLCHAVFLCFLERPQRRKEMRAGGSCNLTRQREGRKYRGCFWSLISCWLFLGAWEAAGERRMSGMVRTEDMSLPTSFRALQPRGRAARCPRAAPISPGCTRWHRKQRGGQNASPTVRPKQGRLEDVLEKRHRGRGVLLGPHPNAGGTAAALGLSGTQWWRAALEQASGQDRKAEGATLVLQCLWRPLLTLTSSSTAPGSLRDVCSSELTKGDHGQYNERSEQAHLVL